MPWEPRGRRGLPYLSPPNPGAQLVASLNPRQGRKASAGNRAQRKVKAEYQIMTTRGQHRPAVRSIAANSQAQDRPQEAALRSCLAGTPVSGAYFHLPNHSWASVVTKVGDAVAPASCLLGRGSCHCIPVVPLEPWS